MYLAFLYLNNDTKYLFRKPTLSGLYTPFGSPIYGGQKPQEREDVTALRCSEPLRDKAGGPSKVYARFVRDGTARENDI